MRFVSAQEFRENSNPCDYLNYKRNSCGNTRLRWKIVFVREVYSKHKQNNKLNLELVFQVGLFIHLMHICSRGFNCVYLEKL